MSSSSDVPEISSVDEVRWQEANRRLPVIRELASNSTRTNADVRRAAVALKCGKSQIYVMLTRFLADPRLTSLLPAARGRRVGVSQISVHADRLIHEVIDSLYLTGQKARVSDVVLEVRKISVERGLNAPSRKAIMARLRTRPKMEIVARREGSRVARARYAPVIGHLEAEAPLSLVQIDHTPVDVIVVDSVTRKPIQRPWLTLAIDVYSRCVAGFHLSLEAPSATSVALCILQAVLPKTQWLAERSIEGEWPVHGVFSKLHLDNAKEFRSEALRRGCEQYGIAIDFRPVRTPHYGGHIERLIGTMMGKVHLLPGTTFSNIKERGDANPEKTAAMTLNELERWLGLAIVGAYHGTVHRSLNRTPLVAWQTAIQEGRGGRSSGEIAEVADPRRFLIDFLPLARRLVRRDGVALHCIHYWSDVLGTWVGDSEPKVLRFDPRDLSRIYLLGPDNQYYDVPYRDIRRPPITLWEQRLALKRLREERHAHVDENALFRTVESMREIVEEAQMSTKAARRHVERRLRLVGGGKDQETLPPSEGSPETTEAESGALPPADMLPVEEWS